MSPWALLLACGLVTFVIRWSFIASEGRVRPPAWFRRCLPLIPAAALSALVVPDLLHVAGSLTIADNRRLAAGVIATAVAWRWRNASLTITSGFVAWFALPIG